MIRSKFHTQQIYPPAGQVVFQEKNLANIYNEEEAQKKKLSFEEWMAKKFEHVRGYDPSRPDDFILWGMPGYLIRKVWDEAQENK